MATFTFAKYHGTGNDFILVDNRSGNIRLGQADIARICHRRFGIGADGLMFLLPSGGYDFEMAYYNSDGREGTMCGNGGRCIAAFAADLGIVKEKTRFLAIDGTHEAKILRSKGAMKDVEVSLNEVSGVEQIDPREFVLDTGSPHFVRFVDDLDAVDVYREGKRIRWESRFQPGGLNVNFVERREGLLRVKTFERGVEDITLSCGTGVTAAAIAASVEWKDGPVDWEISTPGGDLNVTFAKEGGRFHAIWLKGPVEKVFEGTIAR